LRVTSIRLGEDLELDLAAYELRREGRRLSLERIPMEILRLLLEHRDELVTREQIIERVWGQGVFVDTDNSINIAIRKIRTALRDDPEDPHFIRTVTGKGYRFIGPVLAPDPEPEKVVAPAPPVVETPPPRSRRWLLLLAAVVVVALAAGVYLFRKNATPTASAAPGRIMLAVLPFANLTGDVSQDYFSDGFTEEMIARLGSLAPERLGVIARTSVMHYKLARKTLPEMASELGVDYVLEGSVRRDAAQVRITAQLVRVHDQTHLWARQYDRAPTDLLRVQEEIAEAIAEEIQIALGRGRTSLSRIPRLTPRELEAYNHYLAGRHAWNERTVDGFTRAIAFFQLAIGEKPDFAAAYAGLADCYVLQATYGYVPPAHAVPLARKAALKALEIDETLAAAQTSLALVNESFDFDWETAESRFRRAIAIDPNYATAHHWYAELLAFQGRFPEALSEIERARQLDPLSMIVATDQGAILHFARRYDDAILQFQKVLAQEPSLGRAHLIVASLVQRGRYAEALAHLETWRKTDPGPWTWAWAACVQGRAGNPEDAQRALQRMELLIARFEYDPIALHVTAYAGMGKKDEALGWLEKACTARSSVLNSLKVDPLLDLLRDDPRFRELLRCARLG
jgi:TolB-like protein/DNA-binding winged helix-turn-helix (wHTH) protein/Tfp pilus assembly protein PilF